MLTNVLGRWFFCLLKYGSRCNNFFFMVGMQALNSELGCLKNVVI